MSYNILGSFSLKITSLSIY